MNLYKMRKVAYTLKVGDRLVAKRVTKVKYGSYIYYTVLKVREDLLTFDVKATDSSDATRLPNDGVVTAPPYLLFQWMIEVPGWEWTLERKAQRV